MGAGELPVGQLVGDAVELVEAGRRLPRGGVSRQGVPQPALDIVDRRAVVPALRQVRKRQGQLVERALRPGGIRARDHQRRLGAESVRNRLDESFAGSQRIEIDPRAVRELPGEGVVDPGEHEGGARAGPVDVRCGLGERHDEPRRFESEAPGQVGQPIHPISAGREHCVDAVGDQPAAEQAVGRVQVRKVHPALAAAARSTRDRTGTIRWRAAGDPDRGAALEPRFHGFQPRVGERVPRRVVSVLGRRVGLRLRGRPCLRFGFRLVLAARVFPRGERPQRLRGGFKPDRRRRRPPR